MANLYMPALGRVKNEQGGEERGEKERERNKDMMPW